MKNTIKLRLTVRQYSLLRYHLFPGDGKEAVALALCGVGDWIERENAQKVVCIHKIELIPYNECIERTDKKITWATDRIHSIIETAISRHQVIVKFHSHPCKFEHFSELDDKADIELFTGIAGWLDTDFPGISVVMLPDSQMIARAINGDGSFSNVQSIMIVGSDIRIIDSRSINQSTITNINLRTAQAFGQGTALILSKLCIGVVGISGTGSPVVEMLYRLGVGKLILIDNDIVKDINVGRIYNSTLNDAKQAKPKVLVLADAIIESGLNTEVHPIVKDLFHPEVVRQLAQCDIIFGCMDSVDGRDLLNKLCAFYSIPYFDLGVHLKADGLGGVDQVCGTVHYLQPDGSSLFSRGVYTVEDLRASDLRRTDPEAYQDQVQSKYIKGINEDKPAVISVNTSIASLAVNDLLARLHPFRDDPNDSFESIGISLTQTRFITNPEGKPCPLLSPNAGRGDIKPLLNMPVLSERS
jgi:hypothetical protein